jgi:hypothetical protein
VDFSALFHTVTNFRLPRHSNVVSRSSFAPLLGAEAPTEAWVKMTHWYFNSLDWTLFIRQIIRLLHFHWYMNERLQNCHLPTKIYSIYSGYMLNPIKMARLHFFHANTHQHPPRPNKILMKLSPPPKLSYSGLWRVTTGLHAEILTTVVRQPSRTRN